MKMDELIYVTIAVKYLMTSIIYSYAAISDWVKREIPPLVWVPHMAIGIPLNIFITRHLMELNQLQHRMIIESHLILSIVISVMLIISVSILSFVLNLIGGADVLALASFACMYPSNIEIMVLVVEKNVFINKIAQLLLFLPPLASVLIIHMLIIAPYMLFNITYNIIHVDRLREFKLSLQKKLMYILFGKITKVKNIANKKFYYPIYVPGIIERVVFNVDEDYSVWMKRLEGLPPEATIVVVWGIPMVFFITISILIYMAYAVILLLL